jgi:hypothetical protein
VALYPDAKWANVEGSLRQYVQTQLGSTFQGVVAGDRIDFGGGPAFQDSALPEWLQVRLMEPARPSVLDGPRGSGGTKTVVVDIGAGPQTWEVGDGSTPPYAREMYHMLNLNIFVRPAKLATLNSLRLATLRDAVVAKFIPPRVIPATDYAGGAGLMGNMVVAGIDADRPIPNPEREHELLQHNIVVALRWTETWTTS